MKLFFKILGAAFVILLVVVLVRTFTFKSKQLEVKQFEPLLLDDSCVVRMQQAIQFKTISYDDAEMIDSSAFVGFHQFLSKSFPLVFSKMELEKVNQLTLVLKWKGKSDQAKPVVLMAHQDVVPVENATLNNWDVDPFSGNIKNGFLYGRGTIDDKGSLMAILESAELLLKQNYVPSRDIYFVFGHDEERSGLKGAKAVAQLFEQRGIQPEFVLDEGGIITKTKVPGLNKTAAVVGIAEKGYQTLKLKINIPGGHSSMPEDKTAIDELAKAIVKLKENPFKAELNETVKDFLSYIGPEMPFVSKMAMANQWLFAPMIISTYSKSPAGNATIRTTTATTIVKAGMKENLVPGLAEATVNFRTQPGVSLNDVVNHVKEVIDNDQIKIETVGTGNEPRQIANVEGENFKNLHQTIAAFKKEIVVAPYLVLGATDGRYFGNLTSDVFRFLPFTDPEGFHGVNERIKVTEYKAGIQFYYQFIKGI